MKFKSFLPVFFAALLYTSSTQPNFGEYTWKDAPHIISLIKNYITCAASNSSMKSSQVIRKNNNNETKKDFKNSYVDRLCSAAGIYASILALNPVPFEFPEDSLPRLLHNTALTATVLYNTKELVDDFDKVDNIEKLWKVFCTVSCIYTAGNAYLKYR